MTNQQTLRPGLLVSLKTRLHGNVTYFKETIETEHITDDGKQRALWKTERIVADPAELDAAKKARGKAQSFIRRVCAQSAFGLLCPEADAAKLEEATASARAVADEFNATATVSRLSVYVMTGRIAPDDVEAVKAINSEVRDLIAEMEIGLAKLDVKTVREAAARARQLGAMLTPNAEARVRIAIETARKAATELVKAAEIGTAEIDRAAIQKLIESRTSFLDFDDEQRGLSLPAVEGRAIDLAAE